MYSMTATTTSATGTEEILNVVESIPAMQEEVSMKPVDLEEKSSGLMEDMEPLAMSVSGSSDSESINPDGMSLLSGRPKRPLSAYNIFFQYEREKIVSNAPDTPVTAEALKIDPRRRPKKRRHRKSHGKIGFADLARHIAEKWKTIDPESRSVFVACAAKEKKRYQAQLTLWKEAAKKKAVIEKEAAAENHAADMMFSNNVARENMMQSINRAGENQLGMSPIHRGLPSQMIAGMPNGLSSTGAASDNLEYLRITQQVIDMARASLALPLFANLGTKPTMTGLSNGQTSMMNDLLTGQSSLMNGLSNGQSSMMTDLLNGQSSVMNGLGLSSMINGLSTSRSSNLAKLEAALRMNGNQSSNQFNSPNQIEPLQLSNTPLLNFPFGSNRVSNFESEAASLQRMLQATLPNPMLHRSLDTTLQDFQNQIDLQFDSNQALLNQAMSSHHAEFDSGRNDFLGLADVGSTLTGQNGLKRQSHDARGDELLNMINASLREHF